VPSPSGDAHCEYNSRTGHRECPPGFSFTVLPFPQLAVLRSTPVFDNRESCPAAAVLPCHFRRASIRHGPGQRLGRISVLIFGVGWTLYFLGAPLSPQSILISLTDAKSFPFQFWLIALVIFVAVFMTVRNMQNGCVHDCPEYAKTQQETPCTLVILWMLPTAAS